jgi:hypothetical protein
MKINNLDHIEATTQNIQGGWYYYAPKAKASADAYALAIGYKTKTYTYTSAVAVAGYYSESGSSSYASAR